MAPVSWLRLEIIAQTKFEAESWKSSLDKVKRSSALHTRNFRHVTHNICKIEEMPILIFFKIETSERFRDYHHKIFRRKNGK